MYYTCGMLESSSLIIDANFQRRRDYENRSIIERPETSQWTAERLCLRINEILGKLKEETVAKALEFSLLLPIRENRSLTA